MSVLMLVVILNSGCGTVRNDRAWGQDAIYPVKWERVKNAARNAVLDPVTWVSAGGAAVFAIGDLDEDVAEWAADENPVFGSQESAARASDDLRQLLYNEVFATALLTPGGDDPKTWVISKAKGIGLEYLALKATAGATDLMKSSTDRLRPDGSDRRSLPSGHTTSAFSSARLANRNLDSIKMPVWARNTLKTANIAMAGGTAWARVEARQHYPSDVLVGAALGNMVTTFIHDAFMNIPEESEFSFYLEPSPRGAFGYVSWNF